MRILNLSQAEIPSLQGVIEVPDSLKKECLDILGKGHSASNAAGMIRSKVANAAFGHTFLSGGDDTWEKAIGAQEPHVVVLDRSHKDVAVAMSAMQIGPEPGTSIPLLVPVEARNKQWVYLGTNSDIRVVVTFTIDQNGNIVDLANFVHTTPTATGASVTFHKWECRRCGFVYDEELGLPDEGIAPFTRWEDIPDDWVCPTCGATKADFDMVKVS